MTRLDRFRSAPWIAGAFIVAVLASSCDAPTAPPSEGTLVPRFAIVRDGAGGASVIQQLTGMRVTVINSTTSATVADVNLTQRTPPDGPWSGAGLKLAPGTYSMVVQGLVGTQVQHYAIANGLQIVRGKSLTPTVSLNSVVPALAPPPLTNTTAFSQTLTFSTVAGALDYEVQWSKDAAFTGSTTRTIPGGIIDLAVSDVGVWFVRTRPRLPAPVGDVRWSDAQQFTVIASPGGAGPATAIGSAVSAVLPDTIPSRNLTPTTREGWFTIPGVRAGDTIIAETRAARLTPASPLNTTLTLLRQDATTAIVTNDDAAGTSSSDSRIVAAAPFTEDLKVKVGAVGNSVGHYELLLEIRRLPAAPAGLSAVATSGSSVLLTWNRNADNETSTRVERCAGVGCSLFAEIGSTAVGVSQYADAGLTTGESYTYRVRARNAVGNSAYSAPDTVVVAPPTAPDSLQASTISGTHVALSWRDNSTNETGYEVQRCASVGCTDFAQVALLAADVSVFQDTGLAVDGTYRYRVRALNAVSASAFTAIASANTLRPAAPSTLTATTISGTRISLAWSDDSDNESSFRVERCLGVSCSGFAEIGGFPAGTTAFVDSTVLVENVYGYRVRASNLSGSTVSPVAVASTQTPPAPDSLVAVRVSPTRVDLAWSDRSSDESAFELERCAGAACSAFTALATPGANVVAYQDLAAPPDSVLRYRVRARNIVGPGAYGLAASAGPLPSTLDLGPGTMSLGPLGSTYQLTPTPRFAGGGVFAGLSLTAYSWVSRDPFVAAVSSTGLLSALGRGTTWVVATAPGGATDSVLVSVVSDCNNEVAGLAACWSLDGNALDATGGGANGTVQGAQTDADRLGVVAGAVRFSNAGEIVTVPLTPAISVTPTDAFTVTGWFRADQRAPGNDGVNVDMLVSGGVSGPGSTFGWGVQLHQDEIWVSACGTATCAGGGNANSSYTIGRWTQFAFTFGDGSLRLYVDGVLRYTTPWTGVASGSTSTYLMLGGNTAAPSYTMNGALDDVRFYRRVLSATEVGTLYDSGRPPLQRMGTLLPLSGASAAYVTTDSGSTGTGERWATNPSFAIDADTQTYYSSRVPLAADTAQWWQGDLGGARSVTWIRLRWQPQEDIYWKRIAILGSNDGVNFTTIVSSTLVRIDGTWTDFPVVGSHRYIRVKLLGSGSLNHGLDLSEFQVLGIP